MPTPLITGSMNDFPKYMCIPSIFLLNFRPDWVEKKCPRWPYYRCKARVCFLFLMIQLQIGIWKIIQLETDIKILTKIQLNKIFKKLYFRIALSESPAFRLFNSFLNLAENSSLLCWCLWISLFHCYWSLKNAWERHHKITVLLWVELASLFSTKL